ncbi:MAG TPA: hypothetical protein VLX56_08180 [Nitrososphaerales archaeon]|nr:hypothetical protein [Nitrososphaerales archaeon]
MRVFYAHPMKIYGTAAERREVAVIERGFAGYEIVDPSTRPPDLGPGRETEFYLALVDSCDCLVFSRHYGNVTEGVKPEVERALASGKPVYELSDGKLMPTKGPVVDLPLGTRILLRARGALGLGR